MRRGVFYRLKIILGGLVCFILFQASVSIQNPPREQQALTALNGTFFNFAIDDKSTSEYISAASIPDYLDELKDLGMDTVIIQATRYLPAENCTATKAQFRWLSGVLPEKHQELTAAQLRKQSKLGIFLHEANLRQIQVYVGLSLSHFCSALFEPVFLKEVVKDYADTAFYLNRIFGVMPAFAGWYIPDEPEIRLQSIYSLQNYHTDFFGGVVKAIREFDSSRPVIIAPYLSDHIPWLKNIESPSDVAKAAGIFAERTKVNIQAWQDGVGAAAYNVGYASRREKPKLDEYYSAIAKELTSKGSVLWADVEIFGSWYSGNLIGKNDYAPSLMVRINKQLNMATQKQGVAKRIAYLHQTHMTSFNAATQNAHIRSEAARLHAAYKAHFGLSGKLIKPKSYSYHFDLLASSKYPDLNNQKLFDNESADPRNYLDDGWVGAFALTPEIRLNFGYVPVDIDWIGIHLLQKKEYGIRIPDQMNLECLSYFGKSVKSVQFPYDARVDGDYVMSNPSPLKFSCTELIIKLPNTNTKMWTFLSEIELFAND